MSNVHAFRFVEEPSDFPDARSGPADAPLALSWELTPELMLAGYARGIFAWSDAPVTWWSPDPRAIIELDALHVSRRLRRKIKQAPFRVTVDHAFTNVVLGCAAPSKNRDETWITTPFLACFAKLHRAGHAHSVECWQGIQLVGGVFGVALGGFFSAESMFHVVTDASKIAVYALVQLLRESGFDLLDIQVLTPHTQSLGGKNIPRVEYLERLERALAVPVEPLRKTVLVEPAKG